MSKILFCAKAAVVMTALVVSNGGQLLSGHATKIQTRSHRPMRVHQQRDNQAWDSYNWSGYAVTAPTNDVATDVKGTWVVPSVSCSGTPTGFSSYWVGIDGFNSSTVEQTGTDSDCESASGQTDTPTYYSWFEMYPNPSYTISFPKGIKPGDVMTAEVKVTGEITSHGRNTGANFSMTITDTTQGETFTAIGTVQGAAQSSAEWIVEAPEICTIVKRTETCGLAPLADFNLAQFTTGSATFSTTATTPVSTTNPIGGWGNDVQSITMVGENSPHANKAVPSGLTSSGGFNVSWLSPGP